MTTIMTIIKFTTSAIFIKSQKLQTPKQQTLHTFNWGLILILFIGFIAIRHDFIINNNQWPAYDQHYTNANCQPPNHQKSFPSPGLILFAQAQQQQGFDSAPAGAKPKPALILILPQSLKVPTTLPAVGGDQNNRLQQYVAVINNAQNEREDQLIREQYDKLTLQVRDAKFPISGQLFYETTFDYFPPNSKRNHLLIPINLDQVSPISSRDNNNPSSASSISNIKHHSIYSKSATLTSTTIVDKKLSPPPTPSSLPPPPQQLIVSIRPYHKSTGFGSDTIEFVSSAPVLVEAVPSSDGRRSFSVVQTDKPIYKPNERVKIRALIVNENLRPIIGDDLKLQIRNPQKLIVEEIRFPRAINRTLSSSSSSSSVDQTKGLTQNNSNDEPVYLDHEFEFPPEPMLGSWSVHVLHNDPVANDTISFEVKEYVLPPFEIVFDLPKYILPNTQSIAGAVIAKYHYGKAIHGKVQFKFGYKESFATKTRFIARSNIKTVDSQTGRVEFKISSEKFKETEWFPGIANSRLVVEATVTEMTTGHRETAQDVSCVFIKMPYMISFQESIEDFKPGLTQQLAVRLVETVSGGAGGGAGQWPGPGGQKIYAYYQNQNGTQLSRTGGNKSGGMDNFRELLDTEAVTDSQGRAIFNIGPIREDITSILITMKVYNQSSGNFNDVIHNGGGGDQLTGLLKANRGNELASGHHTLWKHESQNGWISLMNKSITHLSVGDTFISDLLIRDAVVVPHKIFYLVVSKGHLISMNNLDSNGLVNFEITDPMMPSIRLVLFALTHDSIGLLSDSMRIDIDQTLDCGMRMTYKSKQGSDLARKQTTNSKSEYARPNEEGIISVVSGRQGDVISLVSVDNAVYSLNNRTRLESNRIVERVKRLDSGCGFGGGRDNLDVFHNAGLMFFKEVTGGVGGSEVARAYIGTWCLGPANNLKYIEESAMGYTKPMLIQLSRAMELAHSNYNWPAAAGGGSFLNSRMRNSNARSKREIDEIERIVGRHEEPLKKACCRLGTLEDIPQNRNCTKRRRIVEKYTHHARFCANIYYECCVAIYGEPSVRVGSMMPNIFGASSVEPKITSRIVSSDQGMPSHYYRDDLPNMGQLDRIEAQTLVRRDFRETWLFEVLQLGNNSQAAGSLEVRLPHSITSWSVSAVALNVNYPMCLLPTPLRITTFQEIFIHLSIPYKVVQGEQIDLVATLFNYSPESQDVLVYMYGVEDICSDSEPGERSERRRLLIDQHSSQAVIFTMIPLKIGLYPIKLVAITLRTNHSDIIERQLNVVPRGKPVIDETTFSLDPLNQQRRSKRAIHTGNLMDEIDSIKGVQHSKVRLTPTRESEYIVPQTQECIVSAIGDKMGQTVQTTMLDVESLIRLPHGCGEQVMIYMGPTLYTARYLSSTSKLTGDSRWRAIRYIQSGYKRILNFRKPDGAFSAFPRRSSSIWLTAFVAKLLCQTERTPFIADEVHVDKTVVRSALKWLIQEQNKESGTWLELNPVYHREMLGGVLRENALTAFVTITLNECAHHSAEIVDDEDDDQGVDAKAERVNIGQASQSTNSAGGGGGLDKLKVASQKAEQALVLDWYRALKEKNSYVLALIAYSLSLTRPHDAVQVLNDLMALAERSQARNHLFWRGDYSIETSAYALQALIELAPLVTGGVQQPATNSKPNWLPGADAVALANWLSSRRSYSGAFESTQDTVVALEALSKFAQLQSTPNGAALVPLAPDGVPSLTCQVSVNNRSRRSIEFGRDNSQLLQTFRLDSVDLDPASGEFIDIMTSGTGLGIMSVKLKYNVFQDEDELCRFNIDSSIEEWQPRISMTHNKQQLDVGDVKLSAHNDTDNPARLTSEQQKTQTNDSATFEEDLFRTFDKSMLNELNLIDLNQNDHLANSPPPSPQLQSRQKQHIERLRLRRSPVSGQEQPDESWTSKAMSSIRSKWSSWISPKTTTTISPNLTPMMPTLEVSSQREFFKRNSSTSRRSTQTQTPPMAPTTNTATGIPPDAHLNILSQQIEISSTHNNKTTNNNSQTNNITITHQLSDRNRSRRLVLLLRVCAHHMSNRRDSEMAVIEIGILSGFKPNEADLKEILNDSGTPAMKYELSADRSLVIIYMEHIPYSGPYCFQFRLIRDSLVYNLQSGYIRVYEYYSPTHSCSNFYTPSRVSNLLETKCDPSGQVCQCASRSLCPATRKLVELSEIHQVNTTSARNQLIELICSSKYDLVSLVRLKSVRYMEAGRMFRLSIKVKSDLRGNLTKIIDTQRQQQTAQLMNSIQKPQHGISTELGASPTNPDELTTTTTTTTTTSDDNAEETSLDYLNLSIDSSCVKSDPLLLHLAHPSQWKQGGELMILFARSDKLEKRYFRTSPKASSSLNSKISKRPQATGASAAAAAPAGPKPKPNILSKDSKWHLAEANQMAQLADFEAQNLQYSLTLPLDKETILHDITYQAKVGPRELINNLILWLEFRSRRERWSCPASNIVGAPQPNL